MGRNNYFQFKQFRIEQESSAMKVGVDGVLLGAWADVKNARNILDVGTGTGLIALMLAQRSGAKITAVEIEEKAATEAEKNVTASQWNDRVEVINTSFQNFAAKTDITFDLIVSNPPFFTNGSKASYDERTLARHNDSLPFTDLMKQASNMLNENGSLALIVPPEGFNELQELAKSNNLFLEHKTEIKPKPLKKVNRLLLQWSKQETEAQTDNLIIYNDDGSFTVEYIRLTRNFYLKF